jgi:hypothetical protein
MLFITDLENNIYLEKSLVTFREKPHLVYDQKINDTRMGIKMVLPEKYDLHTQLEIFNENILN